MRFRNYILQIFLHKRQRKEGKETTKAKSKPSKDERGRRQLRGAFHSKNPVHFVKKSGTNPEKIHEILKIR
jgi:hypothetical protein